ncbi:MAG TPA: anti-sigma regulatory factor [Clostridiales bacterium]|nr:anti-sigma regulatory factor [Clostridiales bacterium]
MSDVVTLRYDVIPGDFIKAGEASSDVKKKLMDIGISPDVIRKTAIAMYEGEINMVIHSLGGYAEISIYPNEITILLVDNGPGIDNVEQAMSAGFTTAPDDIRELGFGAGMGFPNMKKYTDEMIVESQPGIGTRVMMKVNI